MMWNQATKILGLFLTAMVLSLFIGATQVQAQEAAQEAAPEAAPEAAKININTAPAEILQTIPGIGSAKAEAIIAFRTATPFQTTEDIAKVSGIGPAIFEKIKDLITVEKIEVLPVVE